MKLGAKPEVSRPTTVRNRTFHARHSCQPGSLASNPQYVLSDDRLDRMAVFDFESFAARDLEPSRVEAQLV